MWMRRSLLKCLKMANWTNEMFVLNRKPHRCQMSLTNDTESVSATECMWATSATLVPLYEIILFNFKNKKKFNKQMASSQVFSAYINKLLCMYFGCFCVRMSIRYPKMVRTICATWHSLSDVIENDREQATFCQKKITCF